MNWYFYFYFIGEKTDAEMKAVRQLIQQYPANKQ